MRSTSTLALIVASLLVVGAAAGLGHQLVGRPHAASAPAASASDYAARLDRLTWDELPAAAAEVSKEKAGPTAPICAASSHPPARYLGVLLAVAAGDDTTARAALAGLTPATLPPTWLYGAARFQDALHPGEANPFWPPLEAQVDRHVLPALLEARVASHAGRLREALRAYMATNTSQWTAHDLDCFRLILRDAGLATEAVVALRAALRGGYVPRPLRHRLVAMVTQPGVEPEHDRAKSELVEAMKRDSRLRSLAEASAKRLLEARDMFAHARFKPLLAAYRGARPQEQPTETVVLLTVTAAQQRDLAAFDQWSSEVKRRLRTKQAEQWTRDLRSAMR